MRLLPSLVVAVLVAAWAARPPSPRAKDTPSDAFSASRARADLDWVAAEPHPTGSPANAGVRDRLVARLGELGLSPEVQRYDGVPSQRKGSDRTFTVENVVGRVAGRDRSLPPLLFMCHYDSVPGSPGAADDGAGVVAALEVARIVHDAPLAHDVIFLFTDGEELGLLGARQFFEHSPLAKPLAAALNLDTRGGAGRAFLFEIGSRSSALVRALTIDDPRVASASFASFVYDHMPNGTDFTIAKHAGVEGLNYAFIADPRQYHTPLATPDALDLGTLEDMGERALAGLRSLDVHAGTPTSSRIAWSDLLGHHLIAYGPGTAWILVGVIVALLGVAAARLRRRDALRRPALVRGVLLALALLVGPVVPLFFARVLALAPPSPEHLLRLEKACTRFEVAVLAVALGVASIVTQWLVRRAEDRPSARLGLLLVGVLAAVGLTLGPLELSPVVVWPLLPAAAGAIAGETPFGSACRALTTACALAVTLEWAHMVFLAIGLFLPMAMAPFVLLAGFAALPAMGPTPSRLERRILGPGLVVLGLVLALSIRFV